VATKHNSISLSKAQDDEPIFVLRAQDRLAPDLVRGWAAQAERAGCPAAKVQEARAVAEAMERWPARKLPD
jgi:hypothetical protein